MALKGEGASQYRIAVFECRAYLQPTLVEIISSTSPYC